jgi:hypothetical protein
MDPFCDITLPMTERGQVKFPSGSGRSTASVHRIGTPVMGIGLWGLSPLCEIGISRRAVYQMTTSREQARVGVVWVPGNGHPYLIIWRFFIR